MQRNFPHWAKAAVPMVLSTLSTLATMTLAVAPALAAAQTEFDAARGRYDLTDGRVVHLGGTPRRPVLTIDGAAQVALAPLHGGHTASADGRLALRFESLPNGLVTGMRLTERQ